MTGPIVFDLVGTIQGPQDDVLAIPWWQHHWSILNQPEMEIAGYNWPLSDIGRAALEIGAVPIRMDLACSNFWNSAKIRKSIP
jgi:hypothetical protein